MPPTILRELRARAPRLQGPPPGPVLRPAPGRPPPAAGRRPRRSGTRRSPSSRPTTPTRCEDWDAWLARLADVLGPLLRRPAQVGSKRPADLLDLASSAGGSAGVDVAHGRRPDPAVHARASPTCSRTTSSRPQLKGVLSVSGVIGTWAGPRSPGTALRHGPPQGRRRRRRQPARRLGLPRGRHGRGHATRSPRPPGASVPRCGPARRSSGSSSRRPGDRRGAALGRGAAAPPVVVATTHPKVTFLDQLDRDELPEDFVTAIERWKSRSGTVKVNVALDRLPDVHQPPGASTRRPRRHHRARRRPRPRGTGVPGRRRRPGRDAAVRRHLHPQRVRPTLAPEGHHVCRCSRSGCRTMVGRAAPRRAGRLRRPRHRAGRGGRARVHDSILHRQVIGPYDMEHDLRPGRRQHLPRRAVHRQLFHMRPAPATPTTARRSPGCTWPGRPPTAAAASPASRPQRRRGDRPRPPPPAPPPAPPIASRRRRLSAS